jgi:hypothetical protein
MRMRTILLRAALVLVLLGAALALVFGKTYYVHDIGGGDVLWNSNGAYIFVGVTRWGCQERLIEAPWDFAKELLNGVVQADDRRALVTVFHITSSGVERHMIQAGANYADFLTPFEGQIYGNCEGSLCKWTGDKFEIATKEEQHRFGGMDNLVAKNIDKDAAGWSTRGFGSNTFTVDVGGKFQLQINKSSKHNAIDILSVDLTRPGQPTETIWYDDGRSRTVGWKEYKVAFGK